MPCILFIYLFPACLQFRNAVFSTARMFLIIMTNRRVAVEAERDGIIGIRRVRVEMGDLYSDSDWLTAQAAMPSTPEQSVLLNGFVEIILPTGHYELLQSETHQALRFSQGLANEPVLTGALSSLMLKDNGVRASG